MLSQDYKQQPSFSSALSITLHESINTEKTRTDDLTIEPIKPSLLWCGCILVVMYDGMTTAWKSNAKWKEHYWIRSIAWKNDVQQRGLVKCKNMVRDT